MSAEILSKIPTICWGSSAVPGFFLDDLMWTNIDAWRCLSMRVWQRWQRRRERIKPSFQKAIIMLCSLSCHCPTQQIVVLGFQLYSISMTISFNGKARKGKVFVLVCWITPHLPWERCLVSSLPGVMYGSLRYRSLDVWILVVLFGALR